MKKTPYLEQQKGVWYVRKALSGDLADFYGKKVIKHSLKTSILKEALPLRDKILNEITAKQYQIKASKGNLLSAYIEEYISDTKGNSKTKSVALIALNKFKEIVGDIRIKNLNTDSIRKYRRELDSTDLRYTTKNAYCTRIRSFINWLIENEYVDTFRYKKQLENNTTPTAVEFKPRLPFTDDEVLKILKECEQYKDDKRFAWRWWLTLLYFYSGARKTELTQLRKADIKIVDYTSVIDFNVDEVLYKNEPYQKTLKNHQSIRQVPTHPVITNAGFLEWVDQQSDEGFLFGNPNGTKLHRFYLQNYKFTIGGLLAYLKIVDMSKKRADKKFLKQKTLHSTRHTFTNALKQAGVPAQMADEITGHAQQHRMNAHYSQSYTLKSKLKAISKVHYQAGLVPNLVQ